MASQIKKSGYLPSLDGWRAIAILGVIATHDQPWVIFGHSNIAWKDQGGHGVDLFFAISGILICWRILEEEATLGKFRLKNFYIRRLFRIQPAAFSYLAVVAVLMLTGAVHQWWRFWFGAVFLYENFLFHGRNYSLIMAGSLTGHFWTLAVEEHFYLLLSLFLSFVRRYRIAVLAFFLVLLHFLHHMAKIHGLYSDDVSNRRTYWVIQYLALPSLAALCLRLPRVYQAATKYLHPWVVFSATLVLTLGSYIANFGLHRLLQTQGAELNFFLVADCFSFWIIATMLHPRSWTTRILELSWLRYFGRLSYSVYLWHLLIFATLYPDSGVTWPPFVFLAHRPWRYVAVLALAMLSYHLIEKPMIRLGHKLAPPATPGHRDLDPTQSPSVSELPDQAPAS